MIGSVSFLLSKNENAAWFYVCMILAELKAQSLLRVSFNIKANIISAIITSSWSIIIKIYPFKL